MLRPVLCESVLPAKFLSTVSKASALKQFAARLFLNEKITFFHAKVLTKALVRHIFYLSTPSSLGHSTRHSALGIIKLSRASDRTRG